MSKTGRKPWIPTEENIMETERMSAMGLTQEQIASNLGIHVDTFINKKREFPEFSEAVKRGKAKGIKYVVGKLMENIANGNFQAQRYWLSVNAGWKEASVTEITGKDGEPLELIRLAENDHDILERALERRVKRIMMHNTSKTNGLQD